MGLGFESGRGWESANRRAALLATAILVLALILIQTLTLALKYTYYRIHSLDWLSFISHSSFFLAHSDHDIMVWSSLYLKSRLNAHITPNFYPWIAPAPDCAICFELILYPSLYCPLRDSCRRVNRKAFGLKNCLSSVFLFFCCFFRAFFFFFSPHISPREHPLWFV